jgi:5-methylcytosine-specific restriction enzyme subunit McrC
MTGHPHQQQALIVDQAVAMARRHRDQLIAGANLLDSLPVEATADDYARLQQQMDQVAPDVSRLAWGHTLLDAEYRDLWEQSLPREMLYQLAIYALTQPGENPVSIILYPSVTEAAQDQVVEFRGALDGIAKASVILRPVHLLRLNGLLRAGSGVEAERGRQAMVASLIRGVG